MLQSSVLGDKFDQAGRLKGESAFQRTVSNEDIQRQLDFIEQKLQP